MRIKDMDEQKLTTHIQTALDNGINFFDHADIYGKGECENVFGKLLHNKPSLRDKMIIQTKCGINNGTYNFSYDHIMKSVESSLKRLQIDTIDVLLLHRPDTLVEPEEVAKAFSELKQSGKVQNFGVSNQLPYMIELLKTTVEQPLLYNQLQFSPAHASMIEQSILMNNLFDGAVSRDGGILEYSRVHNMTIQAWSPFVFGFFDGFYIGDSKYKELSDTLEEIGKKYNLTASAIAIAWILRHPAKMQVIIGTTQAKRIEEICKATQVTLTHEEWYEIYRSAGYKII